MGATNVVPTERELNREARIEAEHKKLQDEAFKLEKTPYYITRQFKEVKYESPFDKNKFNLDKLYGGAGSGTPNLSAIHAPPLRDSPPQQMIPPAPPKNYPYFQRRLNFKQYQSYTPPEVTPYRPPPAIIRQLPQNFQQMYRRPGFIPGYGSIYKGFSGGHHATGKLY